MNYKVDRWVARARGPLGRPVRWWLIVAGDRGDPVATDAVWELWLDLPDPELWAALVRWRRPHTRDGLSRVALGVQAASADVATAACRTGHPIAVTARTAILAGQQDLVDAACATALSTQDSRLVRFCVEHQLAPADPRRAAVFFLLTGQDEQYQLADPDHSLLALAYQGASEEERSRVRAKVAGEPDLMRVLAGTVGHGGLARLSEREAEYLVDAFAERQDWAGVWKLAKDLPVIDAAAAVRRVDSWRPAGHDAALFDALAAVDPTELAGSHRGAVGPVHLPVAGTFRGSMSPDRRRIALGGGRSVDVFTLPEGGPPQHQERVPTGGHPRLLALDGDVLVISNWAREPGDGFSDLGYVAPDGSSPGTTGTCRFHRASSFARTAAGFAVLTYERNSVRRLHLLSGDGWDFHHYAHRVLDVPTELGLPAKPFHQMHTIATDPGSGRVAFAEDGGLHLAELTGDGLRRLATTSCRPGQVRYFSFSGPDRLVRLTFEGRLQVWRLDGHEPSVVAERQLPGRDAVDLPGAGVVAWIPWTGSTQKRVRYVDGETLADVPTPSLFDGRGEPGHLFGSPDGDRLGVGYGEFVEVIDATLLALADRPLAAATPADVPVVRARLDRGQANAFLELLYACLVHRFGAEVALGSGVRSAGGADDIALGGSA